MPETIAERTLLYSEPGSDERRELVISIYAPFVAKSDNVSFEVDGVISGCSWKISGLPEKMGETVYGADSLQALQLASGLEAIIRRLGQRYDLYFSTGEPYLDEQPLN